VYTYCGPIRDILPRRPYNVPFRHGGHTPINPII
jgi:hypothetical protein